MMMEPQIKPTGVSSEDANIDSKKQINPSLSNIQGEWHALSEEDVKYVVDESDHEGQSQRASDREEEKKEEQQVVRPVLGYTGRCKFMLEYQNALANESQLDSEQDKSAGGSQDQSNSLLEAYSASIGQMQADEEFNIKRQQQPALKSIHNHE